MATTDMTIDEREAFIAGLHVGILSIARDGKGPLALPVWYDWADGEVIVSMSGSSTKAELLRKRGRATFTVQDERPPYRYVSVEGPVTVGHEDHDLRALAVRYLGDELGGWYADNNPATADSVIARLRPEQWLTCDYGKESGG